MFRVTVSGVVLAVFSVLSFGEYDRYRSGSGGSLPAVQSQAPAKTPKAAGYTVEQFRTKLVLQRRQANTEYQMMVAAEGKYREALEKLKRSDKVTVLFPVIRNGKQAGTNRVTLTKADIPSLRHHVANLSALKEKARQRRVENDAALKRLNSYK